VKIGNLKTIFGENRQFYNHIFMLSVN